jgi:hypothetical protein
MDVHKPFHKICNQHPWKQVIFLISVSSCIQNYFLSISLYLQFMSIDQKFTFSVYPLLHIFSYGAIHMTKFTTYLFTWDITN